MPGTTPRGYPYAQPADPLVQWPSTSQALAEKVDALASAMAVTGGVLVGSTEADGTVKIPHGLPVTPTAASLTLTAGMPPALLQICKILYVGCDATHVIGKLWRTDTNGGAGGQPVEIAWTACYIRP